MASQPWDDGRPQDPISGADEVAQGVARTRPDRDFTARAEAVLDRYREVFERLAE